MHADLGLQVAVCPGADDLRGHTAQTGLLTGRRLDDLGLETVPVGPAQVHPQQHLGPVARLGPACAGVDAQIGVVPIVRTVEHLLEFEPSDASLERGEGAGELLFRCRIFCRELGQHLQVFQSGCHLFQRLGRRLERLHLGDRGLSFPAVVPKVGRGHPRLKLLTQLYLGGQVKETPLGHRTARPVFAAFPPLVCPLKRPLQDCHCVTSDCPLAPFLYDSRCVCKVNAAKWRARIGKRREMPLLLQ